MIPQRAVCYPRRVNSPRYAIVLKCRAAGALFIPRTPQISRCIILSGVNLVDSALPVRVGKDRHFSL